MAERRMFSRTILTSDEFLDLSCSARCLYITFNMYADDDGFVNNPKSIMRQCGASENDLQLLESKNYIIIFDSGVIVITHWKIHNYIQKDRYNETKYIKEKQQLLVDKNKIYTINVSNLDTQVRLGKDSIGKVSIDKDSVVEVVEVVEGEKFADSSPTTTPTANDNCKITYRGGRYEVCRTPL